MQQIITAASEWECRVLLKDGTQQDRAPLVFHLLNGASVLIRLFTITVVIVLSFFLK